MIRVLKSRIYFGYEVRTCVDSEDRRKQPKRTWQVMLLGEPLVAFDDLMSAYNLCKAMNDSPYSNKPRKRNGRRNYS